MREPLIKVSRASILGKIFDVTEQQIRDTLSGDELFAAIAALPTDDEKQWMRIYRSNAPELAKIQRKMSVCLDVEVDELSEDFISYSYDGKKFSIKAPVNSYKVSMAIEKSNHEAFAAICAQGCVSIDGKTVSDPQKEKLGVDEIQLLVKVASKFFFQIYLG